ncbi:hypothetical protein ANOM_007326 [Aspergillus nomiae NRRL 13137]|uniref:Uncharacterized protein n=1 Tax=Aspergillus nomiae NRRL (strain ATCC 15546 / NRRL 13137 / CBS 260.88 / M93) TaxID=1509407 RepID=A0A0L1IW74_ASPN3|nr:uncharacterized protein ANOM_007326 [Aspergillus nomiae NRRL 13137]KNG83655.1 hypothetical protein ANOM_007326 [Aspergillus nomiae NRRL 13137]
MARDGGVRPLSARHIIYREDIPYSHSKNRTGDAAMFAGSAATFHWIVRSVKAYSIWYVKGKANMAAELNNRIRRPVPIRVYRVNTHRRHVRPRRRRGRQRQEHASERNHTGPHELPPRPAHVSPELNYGDCGPYRRDVQDLPLRPPAGDKDKENIRPAHFASPAHSQAGAAYDRHDVNMRPDSSTANHLISSSGLAAGTKMESGTPVEHVDNSASVYVQASGAVDVQITRSDTFATSNESGTHENLPSLSFNVSGDMVMTEESQAVADDYCTFEHVADLFGRYRTAHAAFTGVKINQTRDYKWKKRKKERKGKENAEKRSCICLSVFYSGLNPVVFVFPCRVGVTKPIMSPS